MVEQNDIAPKKYTQLNSNYQIQDCDDDDDEEEEEYIQYIQSAQYL